MLIIQHINTKKYEIKGPDLQQNKSLQSLIFGGSK